MTRTVRILRRALRGLREIHRYVTVSAARPTAADRLVARLLDAADSLGERPERGVIPKDARLRTLGFRFVTVRPYLIFYKLTPGTIRVYRVLHGRREYRALL